MDIPNSIVGIVSVKEGDGELKIQNFEGTGFWITSKGHFLTCKHVVEHLVGELKPAVASPFHEDKGSYIPVQSVKAHPNFDLALCYAPSTREKSLLQPYHGHIAMGLDVYAFGFMEPEKSGRTLTINGRLLKGHVTRMNDSPERFPAFSLMELSFPGPRGFSGAPVLASGELVGMIYGNIESRMQTFAMEGYDTQGKSYRELSHRVMEFGMAHPLKDILSFMAQCETEPFA